MASTPKKNDGRRPIEFAIPSDIQRRLAAWIDVDEVGAEGFWLWFRAVLPLLPEPTSKGAESTMPGAERPDRVRELAGDLVDCARERARLTVAAERYFRDNQALTRRLKALEAALRTFDEAGHGAELPPDEEADDAAERYLPHRAEDS